MLLHLSNLLAGRRPSGSAGLPRRCQDCFRFLLRLQESAVLSYYALLRQDIGGPLPSRKVKHASWRSQSMIEYALILVLVAVVVVTVLTSIGSQITAVFGRVAAALGG